ncbi:conserved protein of unknown function [Tenacibaculum sp. 190524A02b]
MFKYNYIALRVSKKMLILCFLLLLGCKVKKDSKLKANEPTTIITEEYELIKSNNSNALLIVFPGGGELLSDTKKNFKIIEKAISSNISVLLINFNRHLWIDEETSSQLKIKIEKIVEENNLNSQEVFIGGMSIGGTVAISIANYLCKSNSLVQPKGVFVVDSPIDLYALYQSSKKDIIRTDLTKERLTEPKFIIKYFENEFGKDENLLINLQKVSPITVRTFNSNKIQNLKNKKIRFYTEPDTLWWKENRKTNFESTNAYVLQKSYQLLKDKDWQNIELIQTENKGYRRNGDRHPHSWSIIDVDDLINWILK